VQKSEITPALVRRLLVAQFPQWADLPITRVELDGWDNTTFRLGDDLSVRLPSGDGYSVQAAKEHQWLPVLAPQLPLAIPRAVALGTPSDVFSRPWSVRGWLHGEPATQERVPDLDHFARDLARFLRALYRIDARGGPGAGLHSWFRGAPLTTWDGQTRAAVAALDGTIDGRAALDTWEHALAERFNGPPLWVHGDIAGSNLLVADGELVAVLDFGCCAVGDPGCDLAIAWTFFDAVTRRAFRTTLDVDDATWARGRGWALWKALTELDRYREPPSDGLASWVRMGWRFPPERVIEEVLSEA
jgi:aminoglycoside phosphotransferase (APT) family kinase protein